MLSRIPDAGPDALGGLPEIRISRRLPAKAGCRLAAAFTTCGNSRDVEKYVEDSGTSEHPSL